MEVCELKSMFIRIYCNVIVKSFLDLAIHCIDKKYFAGTAHQKTGRKFFGGKRNECIGDKNIVNWQVLLC